MTVEEYLAAVAQAQRDSRDAVSPTELVRRRLRQEMGPRASLLRNSASSDAALTASQPGLGDAITSLLQNVYGRSEIPNRVGRAVQDFADFGKDTAHGLYDSTITEPSQAITQAIRDPSVATLTNAGARTALALAPLKPAAAVRGLAGVSAAGLGTATALDALSKLSLLSEATAQSTPPDDVAEIEKRLAAIRAQLAQGAKRAERRTLEDEAATLNATKAAIIAKRATSNIDLQSGRQKDVDTREQQARSLLNQTMEDYESSRKPGRLMQTIGTLGALAPAAASTIPSAVARLSGLSRSHARDYLTGVPLALAAANAKQIDAVVNEPTANPERAAYLKASRVLNDSDPLKAKYDEKIRTLPTLNPIPKQAVEEILAPENMAKRGILSLLEATAAPVGYEGVNALTRLARTPQALARTVGEVPGALLEGRNIGMKRAAAVNATPTSVDQTVESLMGSMRDKNGVIRGANGRFANHTEVRSLLTAIETAKIAPPVAPEPVDQKAQTNRRYLLPLLSAAGVGAGYGLHKLLDR